MAKARGAPKTVGIGRRVNTGTIAVGIIPKRSQSKISAEKLSENAANAANGKTK